MIIEIPIWLQWTTLAYTASSLTTWITSAYIRSKSKNKRKH